MHILLDGVHMYGNAFSHYCCRGGVAEVHTADDHHSEVASQPKVMCCDLLSHAGVVLMETVKNIL